MSAATHQGAVRLSVSIERSVSEAYAFLSCPENLPRWASGLARAVHKAGDEWVADTPEGPVTLRFAEPNARGVLDHAVTFPHGKTVYVPLRLVPKDEGCELVLTLFRRPEVSERQFAADAEWVMRDLGAAKRILESRAPRKA